MPTSDVLARIAAVLMVLSAMWNLVASALWILLLFWLLVGFLWFVPLFFALVELALGLAILATGHSRGTAAGPVVGMFVSLCNFNFFALTFDILALALVVGGYAARDREEKALGMV